MSTTQSAHRNDLAEIDVPTAKDASTGRLAVVVEAMLRRLARRFGANPADCTDLQQETLIALWLSAGGPEPRVSLQTWLYSVSEGVGTEEMIRARTSRTSLGSRKSVIANTSPFSAPEGALASRECATLLLTLLDNLKPREREAAFLDLQQFEHDRIAEKLRCSVSQVRSLLALAQQRLTLWGRQHQAPHDRAPVSLVRLSGK